MYLIKAAQTAEIHRDRLFQMVSRKVTNAAQTSQNRKLQPLLDKNSEYLAIVILQFDDVTVKTIYGFLVVKVEYGCVTLQQVAKIVETLGAL